jgi:hypothetical protein
MDWNRMKGDTQTVECQVANLLEQLSQEDGKEESGPNTEAGLHSGTTSPEQADRWAEGGQINSFTVARPKADAVLVTSHARRIIHFEPLRPRRTKGEYHSSHRQMYLKCLPGRRSVSCLVRQDIVASPFMDLVKSCHQLYDINHI